MNEWTHMSGAGNTFLVGNPELASKAGLTESSATEIVPVILQQNKRTDGQQIEGLMVVKTTKHSFTCDYYNPDGSHGMLCGNGARCAVLYALNNGLEPNTIQLQFLLNGKEYGATVQSHAAQHAEITIILQPPSVEQFYAVGSLRTIPCDVYYVFVPSDHAVISMPSSEMVSIVKALRHHELFPRGVNVTMVQADTNGTINIATYERGVEAITGACGTGAIAAAISLWRQGRASESVRLRPPSGRFLEVTIHHKDGVILSVDLKGDAQYDS